MPGSGAAGFADEIWGESWAAGAEGGGCQPAGYWDGESTADPDDGLADGKPSVRVALALA
jgi:hypothetical protein